jgi:hypothetical protein
MDLRLQKVDTVRWLQAGHQEGFAVKSLHEDLQAGTGSAASFQGRDLVMQLVNALLLYLCEVAACIDLVDEPLVQDSQVLDLMLHGLMLLLLAILALVLERDDFFCGQLWWKLALHQNWVPETEIRTLKETPRNGP